MRRIEVNFNDMLTRDEVLVADVTSSRTTFWSTSYDGSHETRPQPSLTSVRFVPEVALRRHDLSSSRACQCHRGSLPGRCPDRDREHRLRGV